ncbi:MAG: sialate O-acetylesterase [Verrucomicrobiota bacterium]
MKRFLSIALPALVLSSIAFAEVSLPSVFSDHMVLQRNQANPVWGWADPGENITITIGNQTHKTKADKNGDWRVTLDPLSLGDPLTLKVKGKNSVSFQDVLVGEVWICSGQSNMQWSISQSNDADLEALTANFPQIRLLAIPQVGSQDPQRNFEGEWTICSPESVKQFSAVGYFFGRQLHQTLNVPIGLIDNAWGGSAAEAWVRRDVLEADPRYDALIKRWEEIEATYDHQAEVDKWNAQMEKWKAEGRQGRRPRPPRNRLAGQHRPGNLFNGVLYPVIGYGIRGAIWYQGEHNTGRAYQYRHLFPLLISQWREHWNQGDFPFYWAQLADYKDEADQPADHDWAELREAQTMTLDALPNTGQAVLIDLGEGRDIHPRDKQNVAKRLSRWALAKDYGYDVDYQSPTYKSMEIKGSKIRLTFDHVGENLYTFDLREPIGFAIAGKDRKFVWAKGRLISDNQVEVWSDEVPNPVAVRYAWADNPVCNLFSDNGLPATPFRTDEWPGKTYGKD